MADPAAADVREAIIATLRIVPGIGVIHGRERFVKAHQGLAELYMAEREIRGGFVRRASFQRVAFSTMTDEITEHWTIRLYRSFLDAEGSEIAFERVCDAVSEVVLWGVELDRLIQPARPGEPRGPQLLSSEPVMFCGVLCHAALFELVTKRKVNNDAMGVDLDELRKSEAALIPHPAAFLEANAQWPGGAAEDLTIFKEQP